MLKLKKPIPGTFQELQEKVEAKIKEEAERHLILYRDGDIVERHLCSNSGFCRAMVNQGYLSWAEMQHAAQRYKLGMARDGGVIFWQIDMLNQWYDGKIMYYQDNGHRDHHHPPTWVFTELKRFCIGVNNPLYHQLTTNHCLFGLHLLRGYEGTVAVVEAEKTAVVMSERYPNYLWLATGGLSALTPNQLFPLQGHQVILFPDTDEDGTTYRLWCRQAKKAERHLGKHIKVSSFLEQHATPDQKRRKIDLVDYLFEGSIHPV